jgi:hypothetical protein
MQSIRSIILADNLLTGPLPPEWSRMKVRSWAQAGAAAARLEPHEGAQLGTGSPPAARVEPHGRRQRSTGPHLSTQVAPEQATCSSYQL